ncbi:MAG: phosphoenolpyruvate--protein phosphotransferase [Acholeplasmatales bacterium]|nr:phosphoenolpyruvate--protein phosphotransferase [Acholeplasmatales bacterium]
MIKTINSVISYGYAKGLAYYETIKNFSNTKDIECFNNSLSICNNELDELIKNNEKLGEYILFQKLMLNDPMLKNGVLKHLDKSSSIVEAIDKTIDEYTTGLINSPSSYLRERVNDFKDLSIRLKANLDANKSDAPNYKFILITDELYPTTVIKYKNNLLGVVTKSGGYLSHSAILCRELNIPYVILSEAIECKNIIIDTYKKEVILNYSNNDDEIYNELINIDNSIEIINHDEFKFLANVSSNTDVKKAYELGFDGIGLYRTEFMFYNDKIPSYEQQLAVYKEAIDLMHDKPITFRVFDIGDDKKLSYINTNEKGIQNYINNPDIFITQIKALSDASNKVRILLPMIRTYKEYNYLKNWIFDITNDKSIKIGMMLETKEALENIESFVNVNFISIGTNDLAEELYNKSRDSEYDENITLDMINKLIPVVKYANANNIDISICGEIASIPEVAYKLYEIGLKNLSVTTSAINNLNFAYSKFKNK